MSRYSGDKGMKSQTIQSQLPVVPINSQGQKLTQGLLDAFDLGNKSDDEDDG